MVGSESISFLSVIIFFLAAIVLMYVVYSLRKMMDRREYFEKMLEYDCEMLYFHGLKISEYLSTGAIARFYNYIGREFYGPLATLTMMILEGNPTTKLYQGVYIKGDEEIGRHFWAEFEVPRNGVYVADFCWLRKGFCRKKEYDRLLKKNNIRLEAWYDTIKYDDFWDLSLPNILYERMLDPKTSNLMDEFSELYGDAIEWLYFSDKAYRPKASYYEEEIEEMGNYMRPFYYKGNVISTSIIRDFVKKSTRLHPKKKHIRKAVSMIKDYIATEDDDLPF